jgi:mannose-6-phosphate isomerase-like protein (cupin superfamily)
MRKINMNDIPEGEVWSPKKTMGGWGRDVSIALGRNPESMDLLERHPFDIEIQRYPAHSAQWEFYYVLSGHGFVRDATGRTPVEAGDAFLFKPGEAHQVFGGDTEDLVVMCVADNPYGESCYYPDSKKWLVRSPERQLIRSESLDYFDGEE